MPHIMRNRELRTETAGADPAVEPTVAQPSARAPVAEPAVAEPALAATRPTGALATTGLLTLLVGAWAGICVFVGPLFGYRVDGTGAWTWNQLHGWLHLAPGALAVLAGLMLLTGAGRRRPALVADAPSPTATVAGALAVIGGAWLVIGPVAWPVLRGPGFVWAVTTPLHNLANQGGANLGPGVLLCLFGGLAMGLGSRRRLRRLVP